MDKLRHSTRLGGASGLFQTVINVAGFNITVRGRVVDGVVRIGSFWIP